MTQVSLSQLKANPGKYVSLVEDQDVLITKNGKVVAKLVTAKVDKKAALDHLLGLFPKGLDVDLDGAKEERLGLK